MAKTELKTASVLAFERKLDPSDALLSAGRWENVPKAINGQQSAFAKNQYAARFPTVWRIRIKITPPNWMPRFSHRICKPLM